MGAPVEDAPECPHIWYEETFSTPPALLSKSWCVRCGRERPVPRIYVRKSNILRFMVRTERDPESGCLLWTGGTNDKGYPIFGERCADGQVRTRLAHRWIFKEMHGYMPEVVMHDCDTPRCVDWENCLKPGTHDQNMKDMISKGRDDHTSAQKRFTPDQVKDLRRRHKAGESVNSLAGECDWSINAVRNAVLRHTYVGDEYEPE